MTANVEVHECMSESVRCRWFKRAERHVTHRVFFESGPQIPRFPRTSEHQQLPNSKNDGSSMQFPTHRIHGAGIYANIWGILMVNVTIYDIHGSYGQHPNIVIPTSSQGHSNIFQHPRLVPRNGPPTCALRSGRRRSALRPLVLLITTFPS